MPLVPMDGAGCAVVAPALPAKRGRSHDTVAEVASMLAAGSSARAIVEFLDSQHARERKRLQVRANYYRTRAGLVIVSA
eukprot:15117360-Alexandrium_andersonii.AAC.1